ncbi:hypothetical protein [Halioxenophilus aromaticivorans]|uniref:Uncharacterized protein n=1 Tax=Halioxenophilus aromaticivorans TaxID=1306992 RepID=A0AAV3UAB8_9ALTE
MPEMRKFTIAFGGVVFSAGALLLTACSDSGSSGGNNLVNGGGGNGTTTDPVSFSGEAAKGIVIGGVVNVYPIVNGSVDTSTPLGSGVTDSTGTYTVELADYDGEPVQIEIAAAADDSTSMICDLSGGCGDGVGFGDSFPVTDFSLSAVVTEITDDTPSVSVTPLSTVASQLAIETLSAGTETNILQAISNANTSVANRFGITGDITQVDVVDITNPTAVSAADESALQFNFFNAAIVQSVINDNGAVGLEQAVQAFASQYIDNGGLADTETAGAAGITLEDILNGASSIIDSVEVALADAGVDADLSALETDIDARANLAANGNTTPTSGTPAAPADSELQTVKNDVAALRNLAYAIDLTSADTFADDIEMAADVVDADLAKALEALGYAAQAIADAWVVVSESDVAPVVVTDTDTGIEVDITSSNSMHTYSVDQDVEVMTDAGTVMSIPVTLTAMDNGSTVSESEPALSENDDGSYNESKTYSADVDLALEGMATVANSVRVSVESGTFMVSLSGEEDHLHSYMTQNSDGTMSYGFTTDEVLSIEDFSLSLETMVQQLSGTDAITFEGTIGLEVTAFNGTATEEAAEHSSAMGTGNMSYTDMWSDQETIGELAFSLGGSFSSVSGNALVASLSVMADGTGLVFGCDGNIEWNNAGMYSYEETCAEETEQNYADISATLAVLMSVDTLDDDVTFTVALARTGLDDGNLTVRLSSGANVFSTTYQTASTGLRSVNITTASGAIISLAETDDPDTDVEGTITLNGSQYATIEDSGNGILVITYTDGEFESL